MIKLLMCLVVSLPAFAQSQPSLASSQHFVWEASSLKGDTWRSSAWSPASSGGSFNGGRLYTTFNDGAAFGSSNNDLVLFEITAYDSTNLANTTLSLVNNMSSFGAAGSGLCMGDISSSHTCKSMDIWSDGGILYWDVFSQDTGPPFATYKSAIIGSNDKGVTWENYAHYLANGSICDSINHGNANGDAPAGASTDVQWWPTGGVGQKTDKMGKLSLIQVAQDGATPPTLPGGLSNTFHYFYSILEDAGNLYHVYLHRYTGDPMLPASWTHYNAGSWVSNPQLSSEISFTGVGIFSISAFYSPDTKVFYTIGDTGTPGAYSIWSSPDLVTQTKLPAINGYSVVQPTGFTQFSTWMLPTYQTIKAGGRFSISMSQNGVDTGSALVWSYVLGLAKLQFDPPNVRAGAPVGQ